MDDKKSKEFLKDPLTRHILCPGCQRVKKGIHEGAVFLESLFSDEQKADFLNLVTNTERKCRLDNPISRIAAVQQDEGKIIITATTRWLAIRIGKEVQKAFKGTLDLKSSPGSRHIRVYWNHK